MLIRTQGKLQKHFRKHKYRSWQNRCSFLLWHIFLFGMELLEFYDGRTKKSLCVSWQRWLIFLSYYERKEKS